MHICWNAYPERAEVDARDVKENKQPSHGFAPANLAGCTEASIATEELVHGLNCELPQAAAATDIQSRHG